MKLEINIEINVFNTITQRNDSFTYGITEEELRLLAKKKMMSEHPFLRVDEISVSKILIKEK